MIERATRASPPATLRAERERRGPREIRLGLGANWRQFALLVLVNGFVGAMIGVERTALPLVAANDFGIASAAAALSFIATFGLAKAFANLASGWLADRKGGSRRTTLLIGWLIAVPVPLVVMSAPSWGWIVAANALMGVSQGLAWSTTVIMKIDLVGPARRGLAMGLNEAAGYLAVAIAAWGSGVAATNYGLRNGPAYLGVGIAVIGLLLTVFFVRDTSEYAAFEARSEHAASGKNPADATAPTLLSLLRGSLGTHRPLSTVSQAGLVNNLNDGLAWGVFPVWFLAAGLPLRHVAILVAIYPAVWGLCQLWTGALSDRWGRRWLIVAGMSLQGVALVGIGVTRDLVPWVVELTALGLGTALVYPTLLAAVGDIAAPSWRASAVGVYRLWRDLGYVVGALLAGALVDRAGIPTAIISIGLLTVGSGLVVAIRLSETMPPYQGDSFGK